jgi:hypothetical protein
MQENQDIKAYEKLRGILINVQRDISNALDAIKHIEELEKKELYKSMPGVEGVFDGVYLVTDDGQKLEVPANYAAKSRLVYGDRLKVIEEGETKLFKQIVKPERQRVEGILSKKEGKWHLLTPTGTYRVSDIAAEFNFAQINDKAIGIVPKDNLNVPYAALDKIDKPAQAPTPAEVKTPITVVHTPKSPEPKASSVSPHTSSVSTQSSHTKKNDTADERRPRPDRPRSTSRSHSSNSVRGDGRRENLSHNGNVGQNSSAPKTQAPKVTEAPINREFVADITKNTVVMSDDDLR